MAQIIQRIFYGLVQSFPAVALTALLNLIDAVAYGSNIFPIYQKPFSDDARYQLLGIGLYLMTAVSSQLVASLLTSFRAGTATCAIVENIPFYHAMSFIAVTRLLASHEQGDITTIYSTTVFCFGVTALLTSALFLLFALMEWDRLVHKFPRSVLMGCMGGIGIFLCWTAIEMVAGQSMAFVDLFTQLTGQQFLALSISTVMAVIALFMEIRLGVTFTTPLISLIALVTFYLVCWLSGLAIIDARSHGWLLDTPEHIDALIIYRVFSIRSVKWSAIVSAIPTIVATSFFSCIHVPINVPSFARLTGQAFSMRRELLTQSASNLIAALGGGFLANYITYTNSLLFLRSGAQNHQSGIVLAAVTAALMLWGLQLLRFIPVIVILFVVLYLGLCLMWEAVGSTRIMATPFEYLLILSMMVAMQIFGFVPGLVGGLVAALIHASIRLYQSNSDIRYPQDERCLVASPSFERLVNGLKAVTIVFDLEDYLFFGNAREAINELSCIPMDISIIICDMSRVTGLDLNMVEGLLAYLSYLSNRMKDQTQDLSSILVFLWADASLESVLKCIPMARDLGQQLQFSQDSPMNWLRSFAHSLTEATVMEDATATELDALLFNVPTHHQLFRELINQYEQDKLLELTLLTQFRNAFGVIRLHPLESLSTYMAQLKYRQRIAPDDPDSDLLLIVVEGSLRKGSLIFAKGAWLMESLVDGWRGVEVGGEGTLCWSLFLPTGEHDLDGFTTSLIKLYQQ